MQTAIPFLANEVARDLSRFTFVSPGSVNLESLKSQWQTIRTRIDPKAKQDEGCEYYSPKEADCF